MVEKRKKVVVGMSAGVDSTVTAAILKNQGYDVFGVFMHFWKEENEDRSVGKKVRSLEPAEELRKICKQLDIPLSVVNVEKKFKKEIVDYFLHEYENGRTPNPCVACNKEIKFKVLIKKMLEFKADYVATGHYARIKREIPNSPIKSEADKGVDKKQKIYKLFEAKDKEKDQTYFLYNLNQDQLAKILFPIGEYKKTQVREMAKKMKLPIFDKKESQDICFVAKNTAVFLQKYLKLKKGKIVDEAGNVLGEHQGLPLYTLGQRKGINIGGVGPYYVCGKDFSKNFLTVTNKKESSSLFTKEIYLENVNWISGSEPIFPLKVFLRTRYRNPKVSAIIKALSTKDKSENIYRIIFQRPQKSITPGQSVVFYAKSGEILGGGVIK